MRILVVEDERTLASFIERGLRAEGHAVTVCHDGESGEAAALTGDYALALLGLLCRQDRARHAWSDPRGCREPASDRADRARSRRAERGLDRGAEPGRVSRVDRALRAFLVRRPRALRRVLGKRLLTGVLPVSHRRVGCCGHEPFDVHSPAPGRSRDRRWRSRCPTRERDVAPQRLRRSGPRDRTGAPCTLRPSTVVQGVSRRRGGRACARVPAAAVVCRA